MPLPIPTDVFGRFERLSFVGRRPARGGLGGEHRSRRPAPSTDYVDFRAYQPGDDFRRVDWNVYGRLGSLQVKLTEGRERLDIALLLDSSSSMDYGSPTKLTFAAQLVASLAYVGMARSDRVRITCLAQTPRGFGPFGRRARMPDVVRDLSALAPSGLLDLNAVLDQFADSEAGSAPLVVVVSDPLTPGGVASALETLRASASDVVVVHVVSPDELDPRVTGEVELLDAETNETLELGVSMHTLAAYRERFAAWLDARQADCLARGMRYVRVQTDRPLTSVVLQAMRLAGVLR